MILCKFKLNWLFISREPVKIDVPEGRYFVEFRIKRDANGFETDMHGYYGNYGYTNEDYVGLDDVSLFAGECRKEGECYI